MYKKIIGNKNYEINLDGNIIKSDGGECDLHIQNNQITLYLYAELKTIDIRVLSWLSHYELDLPQWKTQIFSNTKFVAINPVVGSRKCDVIPIFTKPIYVDKEHRVIPPFSRYAINKKGVVIEISTGEIVNQRFENGYMIVSIYSPDEHGSVDVRVHRLLGYAWKYNPDFISYPIINHKNGIKYHNTPSNIEWCSYGYNADHAISTGLRSDNLRCKIRNVETSEICEFDSVSKACDYIGISKKPVDEFLNRMSKGLLILDLFEFKLHDDDTEWFSESDDGINKNKYTVKLWKDDVLLKTYKTLNELKKEYRIWNASSIEQIINKMTLMYPDIKLEYITNFHDDEIEALEIKTGKVLKTKYLRKMAELTGVRRPTIARMINTGSLTILKGYVFRKASSDEWNLSDIKEVKNKVSRIKVTNLINGSEVICGSIREANILTGICRNAITKNLGGVVKDWLFNLM